MALRKHQGKRRGPYLAAAFFCERVIREADGPLSVIRIIDSYRFVLTSDVPADFPSKKKRMVVRLTGLLGFKTGDFPGEHKVEIIAESPNGKKKKVHEQKAQFTEPAHGGGNLICNIAINIYEGGLYWFHVRLEGKLVASMPILISIDREQPPRATLETKPSPEPNKHIRKPSQSSKKNSLA